MAGQSSEEEMYNNDSAGPALEEFLHLLGERVRLKGFTKYRAQLDTKSTYNAQKVQSTMKKKTTLDVVTLTLKLIPNPQQQGE